MHPNHQSQSESKYDYGTLFLVAIILVTTSQAVESIQTPVGRFIRGVAIGMSIVCSVTGLVLYLHSQKKR
ncbi:MAG TPA: hypothetical protein VK880_06935 [Anaerolineales bacterium]|nr:hypothetical protein [Anaerolineales bacterium]